jgi:hypothetical protein
MMAWRMPSYTWPQCYKKTMKEARGRIVLLDIVFGNPWVSVGAQQLDGDLQ